MTYETQGARVAAYAHTAGFSGNDLIVAVAIAKAESGWQMVRGGPNKNGTYDWGIWQINDSNKPSMSTRNNATSNALAAYRLYQGRGRKFTDWATYNDGTYQKSMSAAAEAVKQLQANGPAWERSTSANSPMLPDQVIHPADQAIIDTAKAVVSPAAGIAAYAGKLVGNFTAFVLGLVLLILGVVILLRKPIGKVAAGMPSGRAVKAARTVAAPRAARTVADRAADSVAFADEKRRLLAERATEAAKATPVPVKDSSADFIAKFNANQAAYRTAQGVNVATGKR
jgi:hypothetical protein